MRRLITFLLDVLVVLDSYPERVIHAIVERIQRTIGCTIFPILFLESFVTTVGLIAYYSTGEREPLIASVIPAVVLIIGIFAVMTRQASVTVDQREANWAWTLEWWESLRQTLRTPLRRRFLASARVFVLAVHIWSGILDVFASLGPVIPWTSLHVRIEPELHKEIRVFNLLLIPMILLVYTITARTRGPGDRDRAREPASDTLFQRST